MTSHPLSFVSAALYLLLALSWLAYLYATRHQKHNGPSWSRWRTTSWSAGILLIAIAISPQVMHRAHTEFHAHMWVHLALGMLAPLGLVMAAPVTLAMQTIPTRASRQLVRFLNSPFIQFVSHPVTALFLNVGAMYLLYMTPLYTLSLQSSWLSALIHWHFLLAGYLFTWAIAGPDPAPKRPSLRWRLIILFVSVGAHAILSKIMYAYGLPYADMHSLEEIRDGAKLMYYGGDVAELLLIIAFFAMWFRKSEGPSPRSASI